MPQPHCRACEEVVEPGDAFCRVCGHGLHEGPGVAGDLTRTLIEAIPAGIFTLDPNGRVLSWNRTMESQTGRPRRDALGRIVFELLTCLQPFVHRISRVSDTALPLRLDHVSPHEESDRLLSFWFGPILLESGTPAIAGVMEDMTQKIRVDSQLIRSERLAAIGELAAGVAHNFNNIMAAIGGDAQLLMLVAEEESLPPHVVEAAQQIREETMRGGRIAHDLLSFARGAAPKIGHLDVRETLEDAIRLIRNHPAARGVEISLTHPPDLPRVEADANQLHQVFFNLILNALQAMPGGGTLTVSLHLREDEVTPDRGRLEVKFHDTGTGVPPERLNRIFDPFYSHRANGTAGSGLGLPVSLTMIKGIGGDIHLTSAVGIGTTVTVILPIVERRAERRGQLSLRRRGRVLVVDGDVPLRRTLTTLLTRRGFDVTTAEDADEAIHRLRECREGEDGFGLILTEMILPRGRGAETIREFGALAPDVPIVVLTGAPEDEAHRTALEAGALIIFNKPPAFGELLWVADSILSGDQQSR